MKKNQIVSPPLPSPAPVHSGLLLSRLLEQVETLGESDRVVAFARDVRRQLSEVPRGPIEIVEWARSGLLKDTPWTGGATLTGTLEDALRIAGDLLARGFNVQLRKKEGIIVFVDDRGFTQR